MSYASLPRLSTLAKIKFLYAHRAHLTSSGPNAHADHLFFKELYEAYFDEFDSICERIIFLVRAGRLNKSSFGMSGIAAETHVEKLMSKDKDNMEFFSRLLELENEMLGLIEQTKDVSQGTSNLVQGIADNCEKRCYALQSILGGKPPGESGS